MVPHPLAKGAANPFNMAKAALAKIIELSFIDLMIIVNPPVPITRNSTRNIGSVESGNRTVQFIRLVL